MILPALTDPTGSRSEPAEPLLDFVSRLWLRTAIAAWAVWLGCVLIAVARASMR